MTSAFAVPLNALHAIEIVARTGALAPAAEELGVTTGAVSQHLRRAEERLGIALFERTPKGLVPTTALKQVMPLLTSGFAALHEAVGGLKGSDDNVLNLTVGSVFASRWLVWRIGKFSALHPEIELRLVVTGTMLDLRRPDIDCGIRFGRGQWPGTKAEMIAEGLYRPVVSPALLAKIKRPIDVAQLPIIRDTTVTTLTWGPWWRAAGVANPPEVHGPVYDDPALAFDAAIAGHGVLLAADLMSADAVSDGRLARPFDIVAEDGVAYWLVVPEDRREPKKVKLFRDWLRMEVPASAGGYVHQEKYGVAGEWP